MKKFNLSIILVNVFVVACVGFTVVGKLGHTILRKLQLSSIDVTYGKNNALDELTKESLETRLRDGFREFSKFIQNCTVFVESHQKQLTSGLPSHMKHEMRAVVLIPSGKVLRAHAQTEDPLHSVDILLLKTRELLRRNKKMSKNKHPGTISKNQPVSTVNFKGILQSSPAIAKESVEEIESMSSQNDFEMRWAALNDEYKSEMEIPALKAPEDFVGEILREEVVPLKLLSVEDAILCLESEDRSFYMYLDKDSKQIRLLYRKPNGGYGIQVGQEHTT